MAIDAQWSSVVASGLGEGLGLEEGRCRGVDGGGGGGGGERGPVGGGSDGEGEAPLRFEGVASARNG